MHRNAAITIAVLMLASAARAATGGPVEAAEPVNIVVESGLDIGPCETGGALSYPAAPRKGSPYFLLKADAALGARHGSLTRDHAPWLRRLGGPSGANRLFTAANGKSAIVFWSCKAGDCDAHAAYGAYEPRSGRYLLRVQQQGATTMLGDSTATLRSALTCAQAIDDRTRARAAAALKRAGGR
jgi:hypothetical protein